MAEQVGRPALPAAERAAAEAGGRRPVAPTVCGRGAATGGAAGAGVEAAGGGGREVRRRPVAAAEGAVAARRPARNGGRPAPR